ncbi:MAG: phage antirepressor protein, partial [Chloroflexota bacterium]
MTLPEPFDQQGLRRIYDEESQEWYFSVLDVIGLLTETQSPKDDWRRLKQLDPKAAAVTRGFRLKGSDGKRRVEDCATYAGIGRIVQSLPSIHQPIEEFKKWLAKLAKQRIDEMQNPQKAIDRAREIYRKKGYPEDWIDVRLKSIIIREELTDEWQARGVKIGREYAILTSIISRETFGVTTKQHKEIKGLNRQPLRDHMSHVDLVLTRLGEVTTTEIVRVEDVQGFDPNKAAAKRGGTVAGNARKQIEGETGEKIV